MTTFHYVYMITDTLTNEYYIGSRSCICSIETDEYMGSYKTWNPDDTSRLKKQIIKSDFKTRGEAIEYESKLIMENINNELNRNYHIPSKGFNMFGVKMSVESRKKLSEAHIGKIFSNEHRYNMSISRLGKRWEDLFGIEHATELRETRSNKYLGSGNPMYGVIPSKERIGKQKNSLRKYYENNEHPFAGKTHSDRTKHKISQKHNKKVIHIDTGLIFESQLHAADYFMVDNGTVSLHCNNKVKHPKFKFLTNEK